MTKTKTIMGISLAAVFVAAVMTFVYSENLTQTAEAAQPSGLTERERVSVTTTFNTNMQFGSGSGENIVVLDTTGSGTLSVVHVALTTGCNPANNNNTPATAGDSAPNLKVVAGSAATATFGNVIISAM